MRAVLQRVSRASVIVNGGEPRKIGPGLVILLGVRDTDTLEVVPKLAEKCANLRIFPDEAGKLNRSAVELGYEALVVSNFTLYGDSSRGKRPSFIHAAKQPLSVDGYRHSARRVRGRYAGGTGQRRPDYAGAGYRRVAKAPQNGLIG